MTSTMNLFSIALLTTLWTATVPTPLAAQSTADLSLVPILTGLARPVAVRHAGDGSGRLFIVEQAGRILVWDGSSEPSVFLDISPLVDGAYGEQGLLGLAFHPEFATNGLFFVNYIRDPGPGKDRTVIARYRVSEGDPNLAEPSSALTILEIEQEFANHNGGNILFGPDGYLYIGMGDGGSLADPLQRAQDKESLLGKMLRIDPDASPTGANELCGLEASYGIPLGNPFAGIGDGCDEIWAVGLRNPWRWSFDRETGDLFIGDVGESSQEEIDFAAAGVGGQNFGWSCKEGTLEQNFNPCLPEPLTDPIITYPHSVGCAVTGGYRYRGGMVALQGTYVFADACSGNIWFATETSPGEWSRTLWAAAPGRIIVSFGEDENGELYIVDHAGTVLRFEGPCMADATTLCLNQGRFRVRVQWDTGTETGDGQAVPGGTGDSSNLWFFSPNNWELLVKVLDGCAINNHYWVFFAATTDVAFTVDVTDTLTGASRQYANPLGQAADAVTDTSAFATCP
ncbi:MAG: PQQ-dependent sugar dehydrogenase [Acidobacteriota bacterium]